MQHSFLSRLPFHEAKKGKKLCTDISLFETSNTTVVELHLELARILIPLGSDFDKNYSAA